jgi:hypothetical protein
MQRRHFPRSTFSPSPAPTCCNLLMAAQRLLAWPKQASSEARNIVLGVIKAHNAPISTRDLFKEAVKVPPPPGANGEPLTPWARHLRNIKPAPPHPDHPIRSLRYVFFCRLALRVLVWAGPLTYTALVSCAPQLPQAHGIGRSRSHAGC